MAFSSISFLFYFLPLFFIIYYLLPARAKNVVLLAGSLFFYAWGEPQWILLLLASILVTWLLGRAMRPEASAGRRRGLLILGLVFQLGLLVAVKYAGFFFGAFIDLPKLHLPLGVSFYTFHAISYLVDVYRQKTPPQKNLLRLGLYLALFPKLVMGPIVPYHELEPALAQRTPSVQDVSDGCFRFTIGLAKKALLADALAGLMSLCGSCEDVLPRVEAACRNERMEAAAAELKAITEELAGAGGSIRLDMTLAGEMEYYNGLVFQGYLESLPRPVLKGGRYDLLMQKFTPGAGAIGFAVYLDELDRLSAPLPPVQQQKTEKTMLNVALPKGRLGDKVYDLLAGIGYGCPEDYNATRKLVVENPAAGIRYFLVKPSDVAIYVEHGAADVGIVGKDILTEASADVYELLDTGLGKCRMCVAAPADYKDDPSRPVRVATKFVNIAKSYYASIGRDIDIIKLNGSIELAPILGLSDVIVDIVETGTTLRENGLRVVTEFMPISARFIANKASYQFKHREMDEMLEKLRAALAAKEEKK